MWFRVCVYVHIDMFVFVFCCVLFLKTPWLGAPPRIFSGCWDALHETRAPTPHWPLCPVWRASLWKSHRKWSTRASACDVWVPSPFCVQSITTQCHRSVCSPTLDSWPSRLEVLPRLPKNGDAKENRNNPFFEATEWIWPKIVSSRFFAQPNIWPYHCEKGSPKSWH